MIPSLTELVFLNLPGFKLFAICSIILALKMFAVGIATAAARRRHKVSLNPEDAAVLGAQLVTAEHPEVERVLRAHRNDLENIPIFWAVGLIAILAGAPPLGLAICFITFTLARILHTVAYLKGLQPWRFMGFGMGWLCKLALMVMIVIRVLAS